MLPLLKDFSNLILSVTVQSNPEISAGGSEGGRGREHAFTRPNITRAYQDITAVV